MCILLFVIGEHAVKVFETFQYGEGESYERLADVLKKFEEHCNPLERAYEMVQAAEATAEQTHVMSDEQA